MRPRQLLLPCYFERDGDQWIGFCLDFSLVAQADTFDHAKRKLEEQIQSYVYDATAGEDREHAGALLTRRAPLRYWFKFYYTLTLQAVRHRQSVRRQALQEAMPMIPAACH